MSNATVSDVLNHAMNDESFLMRFQSDPEAALDEFDLDEEQEAALLKQDDQALAEYLNEEIKTITLYFIFP